MRKFFWDGIVQFGAAIVWSVAATIFFCNAAILGADWRKIVFGSIFTICAIISFVLGTMFFWDSSEPLEV